MFSINLTMITVGKTYQQVTIKTGNRNVVLPEDYVGPISPGAIPSFVESIVFPKEFNAELEPGVITDTVKYLYLDTGYRHHIKPGTIPTSTKLFINDRNRKYAPLDRPFYLWRISGDGNIRFTEADKSKWDCLMRKKGKEPEQSGHQALDWMWIWASTEITARLNVETEPETKPGTVPEPTDSLVDIGLAAVAVNLTLVTRVLADLNSKIEALSKRVDELEK